jgi:hypothetical protein
MTLSDGYLINNKYPWIWGWFSGNALSQMLFVDLFYRSPVKSQIPCNVRDSHIPAQINDVGSKSLCYSFIRLQQGAFFNGITTSWTDNNPIQNPQIRPGIKNIQIPYGSLSIGMYRLCLSLAFVTDWFVASIRLYRYVDSFISTIYRLIYNSYSTKAEKRRNIDVRHCFSPLGFVFLVENVIPE